MIRIIGALGLLVAAALLICSCSQESANQTASQAGAAEGSKGGGQGKTEIAFWHYFSGEQVKALQELIARFEKENPAIQVKPIYQGRPDDLRQKLDGSFATSPPGNPACSTVYENWTSDYYPKGLMDPVQDHFAGPDGLSKEEQEDIINTFRETNSYDGRMVTMPFNKSIYVLFVNSDMLAQAGFTTAPKTWAEYKSAIEKTTQFEGNKPKTYGLGVQPLGEAFTTLFYSAGGRYLDDKGALIFDDAIGLEALTFLRSLQYPTKHLYVDMTFMDAPFGNRQIAMYVYSSASFPFNAKSVAGRFKADVVPVPHPEGKQPRYLMQGTNVGIYKNRPEAERNAAWKLVRFLTSTKNAVYWATHTGYMPIRYSVMKDPEMQAYVAANPRYALASSLVLAGEGRQEPTLAAWGGIRNELNAMVDRVLNQGADPKEALAATKAKAEALLKRAGGK